ncbi:MAG: NUDIX domain-containing protein [Archangiaceae bacterium]|nr:NUDIX domain-containing protein [Archangiaceae bacterium]
MAPAKDTFCSYCGTAYAPPLSYPRTCKNCQTTIWSNPIPVSVVLAPVKTKDGVGLLVVRRAIQPQLAKLALVGGFLEDHETWQQGGVREIREESDVVVDPSTLTAFWFTSTQPKPNRVLLFSVAATIDESGLPPFSPTNETSERGLIFGPDGLEEHFAFPLHVEAVRRYFKEQGVTGPHRWTLR